MLVSKSGVFGSCLIWNSIYLIQHHGSESGLWNRHFPTSLYGKLVLCLMSFLYWKLDRALKDHVTTVLAIKVEWAVWSFASVKNQNVKTDVVLKTKKIGHRFCLLNITHKNKVKLCFWRKYHCFICFICFILNN